MQILRRNAKLFFENLSDTREAKSAKEKHDKKSKKKGGSSSDDAGNSEGEPEGEGTPTAGSSCPAEVRAVAFYKVWRAPCLRPHGTVEKPKSCK